MVWCRCRDPLSATRCAADESDHGGAAAARDPDEFVDVVSSCTAGVSLHLMAAGLEPWYVLTDGFDRGGAAAAARGAAGPDEGKFVSRYSAHWRAATEPPSAVGTNVAVVAACADCGS
jgi:hypothetical protein